METVIVIDVLAAHDKVRARHRIERPGETASCTIGRVAAADVVVYDPHVDAGRARVTVNEEVDVTVEDAGSVNGIDIGVIAFTDCRLRRLPTGSSNSVLRGYACARRRRLYPPKYPIEPILHKKRADATSAGSRLALR
jgi:hypothetical protein